MGLVDSLLYGKEPLDSSLVKSLSKHFPEVEIVKILSEVFTFFEEQPFEAITKTAGDTFLGLSGSYFVKDGNNQIQFVFKPENEELQHPNVHGIPKGEGAKRELVVYLLAKRQKAPVPITFYVKLGEKVGSLQRFIPQAIPLPIYPRQPLQEIPTLNTYEIQSIGVLDGRIKNGDRSAANLLLSKKGLVGIDHGSSLSNLQTDTFRLDYLNLSQMKGSIHKEVAEQLIAVDTAADAELMRTHGIGEEPIKWMTQSTLFLQMAVQQNLLTLSDLLLFENQARDWLPYATKSQFSKVLNALGEWKQTNSPHLPYQIWHQVS